MFANHSTIESPPRQEIEDIAILEEEARET